MTDQAAATLIEERMPGPIVAIDFDGTIVKHRFPDIGDEVPGAIRCMKKLQSQGVRLILLTMRSDENADDGPYLSQAVDYCREQGIEFWAVNDNPEQPAWTSSRKVYAHQYIDDAATGCPLTQEPGHRPYVDWSKVESLLSETLGLEE